MIRRTLILCVILSALLACRSEKPPATASSQTGVASWYGVPFDGRPTASGEIFDKGKLTAAHRTLPFGSQVRVYNLLNQKTVEVKVNDRGPFAKKRIIDLSEAAAGRIGIQGVADVKLEILSTPPHRAADTFAVQVAMLPDREEAARLRQSMEDQYGAASLALREGDPPLWRVLVGMEPTEAAAESLASRIQGVKGESFVVLIDPQ